MVMGDYNLPHLSWNYEEDVLGFLPLNASSEQELVAVESLLSTGLKQIKYAVNSNGKLLALYLSVHQIPMNCLNRSLPETLCYDESKPIP